MAESTIAELGECFGLIPNPALTDLERKLSHRFQHLCQREIADRGIRTTVALISR